MIFEAPPAGQAPPAGLIDEAVRNKVEMIDNLDQLEKWGNNVAIVPVALL